jgi:molybdopterin/thiamine biosynthesis adenylyltransferase
MTHIWYLNDLERLVREQDVIEQLRTSTDWLIGTTWNIEKGALALDAIIRAHQHDYHVRMTYPAYYPSSPPTVRPLNAEQRLSAHQYGGADGPLCLEWGPDTWHPDFSGVEMLESTYRLFDIENPLGEDRPEAPITAPSRHQLTPGQEVRFSSKARLYISPQLHELFSSLPAKSSGTFKFSWHIRPVTWVGLVHQVHPQATPEPWNDRSIPNAMKGSRGDDSLSTGAFYKTSLPSQAVTQLDGIQSLADVLGVEGHDVQSLLSLEEQSPLGLTGRPDGIIVIDESNQPHFFFVFGDGATWRWVSVFSEAKKEDGRQPDNLQALTSKSVGIVGLGSIGSKMAETFARMGVGQFYLFDHDLFLPENVTRHALDWRNIADHKVDAVQDLISRINPVAEVTTSKLHLTGQESTAAVSAGLQILGECDIIIDATADPKVFNLLAGVASAARKAFVWMEVYGGGRGGMIARSRPGCDPGPYAMRGAYNWYCEQNPPPEGTPIADYTTEEADGRVYVASDADVSIIAHHAARFAVDTVLEQDSSEYPHSLYLIGLSRWWVFDAPFHTIPIATDGLLNQADTNKEQDPEAQLRGLQMLQDLLGKKANGTTTTS